MKWYAVKNQLKVIENQADNMMIDHWKKKNCNQTHGKNVTDAGLTIQLERFFDRFIEKIKGRFSGLHDSQFEFFLDVQNIGLGDFEDGKL